MLIYHITTHSVYESAIQKGSYVPEGFAQEGFIHASTRDQVIGTANLLFHGSKDLVLLLIDTEKLVPDVKFEPAPGSNQHFPHIYGPINLDAISQVVDFPSGVDGSFHFPNL